jgi:hypothetical protein
MTEDTPIRFDAIDPARSHRHDAVVASIVRSAAPFLARRRAPRGPLSEIERMYRPLLAAAAAIVLFAGVSLVATAPLVNTSDTLALVDDGLPSDLTLLLEDDGIPSLEDLLEQQHEESR